VEEQRFYYRKQKTGHLPQNGGERKEGDKLNKGMMKGGLSICSA